MNLSQDQLNSKCLMLCDPLPQGPDIFECRYFCHQCGFWRRQWDNWKADEYRLLPDGTCGQHNSDESNPLVAYVRKIVVK